MFVGILLLAPISLRAADFQGEVSYKIHDQDTDWTYNIWLKGDHARAELRAGGIVYGTWIYDMAKHETFLVNESAKTYSRSRRMPGFRGGRRPHGGERHERKPVDLKSIEKPLTGGRQVAGQATTGFVLKGKGPATEIWMDAGLLGFRPQFLPDFKPLGGKEPALALSLGQRAGFPLLVEQKNWHGSVVFSMEATAVKPGPVDDSFFQIPADFQEEETGPGGRRPGGAGRFGGGGMRGGGRHHRGDGGGGMRGGFGGGDGDGG